MTLDPRNYGLASLALVALSLSGCVVASDSTASDSTASEGVLLEAPVVPGFSFVAKETFSHAPVCRGARAGFRGT